MRGRRLPMSSTDPRRLQGDPRATNRQDSIDAPAMAETSVSRHAEINFFGPQYVSHFSLWTICEPNVSQTTACAARGKCKSTKRVFAAAENARRAIRGL